MPLYKEETTPVYLDTDAGGWVASIFMLGCAVGPFASLTISHVAGRKTILICAAVPWIISWLTIAFATSVWVCRKINRLKIIFN